MGKLQAIEIAAFSYQHTICAIVELKKEQVSHIKRLTWVFLEPATGIEPATH